jgi:hypothetical protein
VPLFCNTCSKEFEDGVMVCPQCLVATFPVRATQLDRSSQTTEIRPAGQVKAPFWNKHGRAVLIVGAFAGFFGFMNGGVAGLFHMLLLWLFILIPWCIWRLIQVG